MPFEGTLLVSAWAGSFWTGRRKPVKLNAPVAVDESVVGCDRGRSAPQSPSTVAGLADCRVNAPARRLRPS